MRPLVIFDLDGTLADTRSDLCASVNYVRLEHGLAPIEERTIGVMIGDGAAALVARALDGAENVDPRDALRMFLDYYREHMLDETRLYPGVVRTLDALGDCDLAVLTNKPYRFSCRMLKGLGIYRRFSAVYGGNSFARKKPDPTGIVQILSDTRAEPGRTWMVGDSAVDVRTGQAAGVRTCGVTYGYAPHTFDAHPPDYLIDEFTELPRLVYGVDEATSAPGR